MNEIMKNEMVDEASNMLKILKKDAETLRELRQVVFHAQLDYEKKDKETKEFVQKWTIESAMNDPDFDKPVDPRTGRTNQEWTQLLVESKLTEEPEYVKLREELYQAQEVLLDARHRLEVIADTRATIGLEVRILDVIAKVEGIWMSDK